MYVSTTDLTCVISVHADIQQNLYNLRVSDQNGVSLLYIMLEIHHSGQEPSLYVLLLIYFMLKYFFVCFSVYVLCMNCMLS